MVVDIVPIPRSAQSGKVIGIGVLETKKGGGSKSLRLCGRLTI
jgi:hypothetical protein